LAKNFSAEKLTDKDTLVVLTQQRIREDRLAEERRFEDSNVEYLRMPKEIELDERTLSTPQMIEYCPGCPGMNTDNEEESRIIKMLENREAEKVKK